MTNVILDSVLHQGCVISLRREMGLFKVTMWGVGIILGAGIYVLIGEASSIAGNSVWYSIYFGGDVWANLHNPDRCGKHW